MDNLPMNYPPDAHILKLDKNSYNFKDMLAAAVQLFNVADIIGNIQTGMEYVVQVPVEHQAELANHTLQMMQGQKDGKMWATLVRVLENGKQEIVCNCPIKEELRVQGNPVQKIADSCQNFLLQQKMAELSDKIQEVYDVVVRIEDGQVSDRIGKLISGRNEIERALANPDSEGRVRELELARNSISEAQGQIGENFKKRIEAFKKIPDSRFQRTIKDFFSVHTDFLMQQNNEFKRLQDYFESYLFATKLLAESYVIVGDTERAQIVYDQTKRFIETIDFSSIQTLDLIYKPGTMKRAFYHRASRNIEADRAKCLFEAKPFDYVEIRVEGEIMEGILTNEARR